MNNTFMRGMATATELTRSGKVHEATAMIQSLLQPRTDDTGQSHPQDGDAGIVIDGEFTRLGSNAPPQEAAASSAANSKAKPAGWRGGAARTGLAETVRKIAAGGMPAQALLSTPEIQAPAGARFLSLTHRSAHGARGYRLYIPAKRPNAPMPLIVMLHGCTQSPEDFAVGTGMNAVAEAFGCLIAYPGQPSGANVQKCWNWFRPEDQVRDRGEPALLAGVARDILRDHPADPSRVYIAGLSAGGAAAAIVAAAYPDIFSAAGIHSGLPAGCARDVPSAFAAMRGASTGKPHDSVVPTIVFHGLADSTVNPDNGAAVLSQALHAMPDLYRTTQKGRSVGGRAYRVTAHCYPDGRTAAEHWEIDGAGHAWAGGDAAGSHTDPNGPDASRQMVRFFLQHTKV